MQCKTSTYIGIELVLNKLQCTFYLYFDDLGDSICLKVIVSLYPHAGHSQLNLKSWVLPGNEAYLNVETGNKVLHTKLPVSESCTVLEQRHETDSINNSVRRNSGPSQLQCCCKPIHHGAKLMAHLTSVVCFSLCTARATL